MKGAMGELEDSEKKVELEKEKPRSSKNIIGLIFILLIVTILTVLVGLYVGDVIHY
jgi:flagellar basal body-associated protein FliL